MISIEELSKVFSPDVPPALNKISATIKPGQITGIVGPDGAGKTTLIRMMAGILTPTSGRILIDGLDSLKDASTIHRMVGYMPQKFGLYEDLTVIENLTLYADLRGIFGHERRDTFEKLLMFTSLTLFKDRLAKNLSGGMKQKLGLACALLKRPSILFMDEPSVGVDPISRRELWKMVRDLADTGTTVVWSTSYLDEAENCTDVHVLNEGNLLYSGPPAELVMGVEGRVYQSVGALKNRRAALLDLLHDTRVVDGIVQGDAIRVTMTQGLPPEREGWQHLKWESVPANFEDGFIDLLGGITERHSMIADLLTPIPKAEEAVIIADTLTKKFGSFTATNKVSFQVRPGEIFGFLGPNGAGKSTTFKMLCGLLKPTSGRSTVLGYDMRVSSVLAGAKIGYMAQKFSLFNDLTVSHNLEFFAGAYNLAGKDRDMAVSEMIETFDLAKYLNEPSGILPLGYKQRLALSCALMHRPSILFLDEPTSGVDPITRREFWMHINGMVQKGVTIMVTTHFMDEAEYCDRICLIYAGNVIALGSPDELKHQVKTHAAHKPTIEDTFIALIQNYQKSQEQVA
jgi:ABC-2 type transport system ATP-binding protein